VILGNGYFYLFPTHDGNAMSVQISSGDVTQTGFGYSNGGTLDPQTNAIYTDAGLGIEVVDVSNGAIQSSQSVYLWGVRSCAPYTVSGDGGSIYSACGGVFSVSSSASPAARYIGSLPGIGYVASAAVSTTLQHVAVIPIEDSAGSNTTEDNAVDVFSSSSLNPLGQFATTPFAVNGTSFTAHGRWVFYNANSTAIYVVTQADSTASLALDYAVETVDVTKPNSCGATFSTSSARQVLAAMLWLRSLPGSTAYLPLQVTRRGLCCLPVTTAQATPR
jgi:hypothetical protein